MKNVLKKIKNQPCGYSLIELLIYIGLVGVIIVIFTAFTADVLKTSAKALTIKEVNQSARLLLARITQEIKTAKTFSVSPNQIDLTYAAGTPVTFSFDDTNDLVNYNDGAGNIQISNNTIRVTHLGFQQTVLQTYPLIQAITIDLTVEQKNPQPSSNQKYQLQLSSTVTPRPQLY